MDMSVSVVVTNYNTASLTAECVGNIERSKGERSVQVVVVDDDSSESLPGRLTDWAELVENTPNQGHVRSVNIGVR